MDGTEGGWLWAAIPMVLVAALGLAIFYGYRQWSQRRRKTHMDRARENEAIKEVYGEDSQ